MLLYLNTISSRDGDLALKLVNAKELGYSSRVSGFNKGVNLFNLAKQQRNFMIVSNRNSFRLNQPKICVGEFTDDFLKSDDFNQSSRRLKSIDTIVYQASFPALYALTVTSLPKTDEIHQKEVKRFTDAINSGKYTKTEDITYMQGQIAALNKHHGETIQKINALGQMIMQEITPEEKIEGDKLVEKLNKVNQAINNHIGIYKEMISLSNGVKSELNAKKEYRPKITISEGMEDSKVYFVQNTKNLGKLNSLAKKMQSNLAELCNIADKQDINTQEYTNQMIAKALKLNSNDNNSSSIDSEKFSLDYSLKR